MNEREVPYPSFVSSTAQPALALIERLVLVSGISRPLLCPMGVVDTEMPPLLGVGNHFGS